MADVVADKVILELMAKVDKFNSDTKKAESQFDRSTDKMVRDASQSERRIKRSFDSIGAAAKTNLNLMRNFLAGVGIGIGATGVINFVRTSITQMTKLAETADRLGVGIENLQRLRYAFSQVGVESNTTDMALQRFNRRVADASAGGGELYKILKANNVQVKDGNGKLRSQMDILKDYANLIKNAGSAQEQLKLAFAAFDSEGVALVTALRNGEDGLQKLLDKTDEAGGVLEEELVRRAQQLDLDFADLWRNFEINAKDAIISAADQLDLMRNKLTGINEYFFKLGRSLGLPNLGEKLGIGQTSQDRINQMVPFDYLRPPTQKQIEDMIKGTVTLPPVTVIPPTNTGGSGGSSASKKDRKNAYEREVDQINRRIKMLDAEREAQEKLNPLVDDYGEAIMTARAKSQLLERAEQAGLEITPKLAKAIDELATGLGRATAESERFTESQNNLVHRMQEYNDIAENAMGGFIHDLVEGKSAADALAGALKKVGDRLIDIALNDLFNPSGQKGGLFGQLFGSLFGGGGGGGGSVPFYSTPGVGLYAKGTNNHPGGWSIVGEEGPELLNIPKGSQIFPNGKGPSDGGSVVYSPVYNVGTGVGQAEIAALRKAQEDDRRAFQARVVTTINDQRKRGRLVGF